LSYLRRAGDEFVLGVFNFTPVPRLNYRIGVPKAGIYEEILNSDSEYYGGSNTGNYPMQAESREWMGRPYSIVLTLPPLGGIVLKLKSSSEEEVETVVEKDVDKGVAPEDEA
jgi:1,4-alpha-glucan branching enzyme